MPFSSASDPLYIPFSSQTARNEKPSSAGPFATLAVGFLLLPLASMKRLRRQLRRMRPLTVAVVLTVLSLGALLGLSGCGENRVSQTARSYTVAVTATDVTTGSHTSADVTLNVQ